MVSSQKNRAKAVRVIGGLSLSFRAVQTAARLRTGGLKPYLKVRERSLKRWPFVPWDLNAELLHFCDQSGSGYSQERGGSVLPSGDPVHFLQNLKNMLTLSIVESMSASKKISWLMPRSPFGALEMLKPDGQLGNA
jgi:hypothetical protein